MPALAQLMMNEEVSGSSATSSPLPAKIKRVIFLFMYGGPSSIDTFDYKPQLARDHGKPLPFEKPRVQFRDTKNLFRSPWKFRQYGDSGTWVSELFPHVTRHVDRLTFVHSLYGSNAAHGGALLKIHTGSDTFVRPSMGAWISYGLGTENSNLPAFVTIDPTLNHGGVQNFGASFLPAQHQGVRVHGKVATINDLVPSSPVAVQAKSRATKATQSAAICRCRSGAEFRCENQIVRTGVSPAARGSGGDRPWLRVPNDARLIRNGQ